MRPSGPSFSEVIRLPLIGHVRANGILKWPQAAHTAVRLSSVAPTGIGMAEAGRSTSAVASAARAAGLPRGEHLKSLANRMRTPSPWMRERF
jgi:hypothetical protein